MTASIIIISNNNKDIVDKPRLSKVLCIQPSLGYILEVCHLQLLIIVTVLSHSHYSFRCSSTQANNYHCPGFIYVSLKRQGLMFCPLQWQKSIMKCQGFSRYTTTATVHATFCSTLGFLRLWHFFNLFTPLSNHNRISPHNTNTILSS